MTITKTDLIHNMASAIVSQNDNFHTVLGAGHGNLATNSFMTTLRSQILKEFNCDYSEKCICGENAFAVDFYIQEESTIIEIALGLPNSASEYEKDILKALVAKKHGYGVNTLVFISRPGAKKKCRQPGRLAIKNWVKDVHDLDIVILELPGIARIKNRVKKGITTES